ncbi:NADH-quinone oxidoreductase subunit NuoK [Aliarcobacter butzleri]|jgi:NADH-quinone oxidoreductase subunit K|uniref:NADH-quinone oxidoreductase subunit K n=1 Tax=Aliarcobacter butzleri L351 TaxID=1447259 RepID=A0A837J2W6_9BACT|nr:NADH-quinone oxidoreductase subunit NuoK [Aliarcobacter butzleri]KLD99591.1 NADH:ubiquinone oxidoreductase subunit K [Aliarcobacter butzleri L351]KLE12512.1 NADH:ubiquinone oxidoreductase subunit K [Aliarcobacter butzleri L350]MCT7547617.1 NADH-quinone oxidoreductase subunit NuoK [Aliarcobacter butzleri]MDN5046334.1 NADH-quinone oxidoreductase subunit NuoK [Aliarcobacter butzleri]MDN5058175.1 NADH-quinone oxidoreductase subunit NuoK [Aliarcobacter butzleri]
MVSLTSYAFVSMMLFSIGAIGVIARKNIFVIYMSIEMMLNGINLFLITFARYHFNIDPQIITIMVISIAAAEAAIFLSVIILLFRSKKSLNTDVFTSLTQGEN